MIHPLLVALAAGGLYAIARRLDGGSFGPEVLLPMLILGLGSAVLAPRSPWYPPLLLGIYAIATFADLRRGRG